MSAHAGSNDTVPRAPHLSSWNSRAVLVRDPGQRALVCRHPKTSKPTDNFAFGRVGSWFNLTRIAKTQAGS
jgi:hypothetical protein